ncbi:hypothetical protein [Geminocystis herdmanii]|uniref:hypothetical protein n=1 Tax=Geminocystis herdmanii TaxID=669359 RepID=UPI0003460022|nr:hypothetical protein [Geminocystis herdmanii]
MNSLLLVLENFLKLFGIFWIAGGMFALKSAKESQFMDTCLEQLQQKKVDRLVSNFMLIGGILTLLSGIGLLMNQDGVIFILLMLIISQLIYFDTKKKRFAKAKTDEEKEEYTIQSTTYNAFLTSIYITIIVVIKIILSKVINL